MATSTIKRDTVYPVPIELGGTGAKTAATARAALNAQQTLKMVQAHNPTAVTIPAYGFADVALNWTRTGKTWLYNALSYSGNTGGVIVNTWFNGDTLTMSVRNVLSQSITLAANSAFVRVIYLE